MRWSCWKLAAVVMACIVGGCFLPLMIVHFLFWSGGVKSSLDAQHIPTAQFLLLNPQPTPHVENSAQLSIRDDEICISLVQSLYESQDVSLFWSEVFINYQRVGKANLSMSILTTLPGVMRFCVENALDRGIHIVEFQARSSPWQLLFSQQWAIEIEVD